MVRQGNRECSQPTAKERGLPRPGISYHAYEVPTALQDTTSHVAASVTNGRWNHGLTVQQTRLCATPGLDQFRLRGRGNDPLQIGLMRQMQQTHGNRAVQLFIRRKAHMAPSVGERARPAPRMQAPGLTSGDRSTEGRAVAVESVRGWSFPNPVMPVPPPNSADRTRTPLRHFAGIRSPLTNFGRGSAPAQAGQVLGDVAHAHAPTPVEADRGRAQETSWPLLSAPGIPVSDDEMSSHKNNVPDQLGHVSYEGLGRPAPDAKPELSTDTKPGGRAAPSRASLPNAKAADEAQQIIADSLRNEAQIAKIASANRQQVRRVLGGLRTRFSTFFAQSSAGVQKFIAGKQAELTAAAAQIFKSARAMVTSTAQAAEAQANRVRETINGAVQGIVASLQPRLQGIADQIVGVINRFPLPNIPGVAQVRAAAANVLRRAAGAVTGGLGQVRTVISSALNAGVSVIRSVLDVLQRLAGAALSQASSAIQRVLHVVFQTLSRTAGLVISALRGALNATILPMLNRLEGMIQQAVGKAQLQAVSAIRTNRDQYLEASSAPAGSKGDKAPAAAAGGSSSGGIVQEIVQSNRMIVQTFQERSTAIIGSILERVTGAAAQMVQQVTRVVAQASQLIASKIHEVITGIGQIVRAVGSFIQSVLQAVTDTLSKVVEFVRSLAQNPVDALLRFALGVLDRMIDFISRLVRSVISAITGSTPTQETGQFVPPPTLAPTPAFVGPALPIIIAILTAIVVWLGGSVTVIGGTIMIIIGGGVFFVSTTVVVVVAIVLALLVLLLLIYLLYRLFRRKKPKKPDKITSQTRQSKPAPQTRTSIGVGEEVHLTYTGGNTTWSTTGGTLSATTGPRVWLTAPDTAGSITVTAGSATIVFTVIAPSGVVMDRRGAMQHDKGYPNSGIRMRPYLAPDSVNFYNIVYHEMDVNGVPTPGEYSCNPFSKGHCKAGGGGVPCPDLGVTNNVVSGKGTETKWDDCAYSGWCTNTPPFAPGSVSLSIPHEYKVGGGSAHPFAPVSQVHTVEADGNTLTTTKDGANGNIKVNDPSSSNGC